MALGYHDLMSLAARKIIAATLRDTKGNVKAAAHRLKLQRTYLNRLIRQHCPECIQKDKRAV